MKVHQKLIEATFVVFVFVVIVFEILLVVIVVMLLLVVADHIILSCSL